MVGSMPALLQNNLCFLCLRDFTKVLENQQSAHQADRFARAAVSLTIQRKESRIKFLPVYFVGQFVEWVRLVQNVLQTAEIMKRYYEASLS